ncbi:MAG: tryptophan--tRNA ligase [Planctomycetes bacterium]|nr:tryptophan--tRNA ligase [Planctomycetota bacterium]
MSENKPKRVLSGLQPSGKLHLGNYFGAIKQYIELQEGGNDVFYFVANYHAMTSVHDRAELRQNTLDVVLDLLALGLDPERATIFLQTDVPEVCELSWILSCVTPMALLEKCHSYKDKLAKGIAPNHALFAYPVLMAADILAYDSQLVPVGQDQKQHIEVTRDLAIKANLKWDSNIFKIPEPYIVESLAVVPGIDGQKMSKSYDNTLELFMPEKALKKRVNKIVTDSIPVEDPKDPGKCNVFALLKLFLDEDAQQEWAEKYRTGGMGYGEAKNALLQAMIASFGEARERRKDLENNLDYIHEVLKKGSARAREVAQKTLARAREAVGIY